jgi:hypothetical protein
MTLCTATGLELIEGPPPGNYRIARSSYGALAPRQREAEADGSLDASGWSRFDTVGRTLYTTDDRLTSFMELLAPYRTEINGARRALQKDADAMGIPLEQYWEMVVDDWDQAGTMRARWLPRAWRDGRALYRVDYPTGWWVDIMSTHTLAALSRHLEDELADLGIAGGLTVAHVTADDRVVTTLIARWLRETATLFDGTQPLGIRFTSKHGHPTGGTGTCWAYWMRATDAGLIEPVTVTDEAPIDEDDTDLNLAQELCKIKTR